MQQLSKHPDMSDKFLADTRFKFAIDTIVVAQNVIEKAPIERHSIQFQALNLV